MLATMRNEELVGKLIALAEGNLDLVQHAIRTAANGAKAADLEKVVEYIVEQRRSVVAAEIA
jgi:hypothetical protein